MKRRRPAPLLLLPLLLTSGCGTIRAQAGFGFGFGVVASVPVIAHVGLGGGVMMWGGLDYHYHRPPKDCWERHINVFGPEWTIYNREFIPEEGDRYKQGHICFGLLPILSGLLFDEPVRNALAFEIEVQLLFIGFRLGFNPGHLKPRSSPKPTPKPVPLPSPAVRAALNAAAAHMRRGEWAKAEARYREGIALQPTHGGLHAGLGLALLQQRRYAEAKPELTLAIRYAPTLHLSWRLRGLASQNLGELDDALRDYDHYLRLKPTDAVALERRAEIRKARKEYSAALRDYRAAFAADPERVACFSGAVTMHMLLGDKAGARDELRAGLKRLRLDHPERRLYEDYLRRVEAALPETETGGRDR